METIKRVSKCAHEYGGKKYAAGDPVEVESKHVLILLVLGHIEPEEGEMGFVPPRETIAPQRQVRKNGARR